MQTLASAQAIRGMPNPRNKKTLYPGQKHRVCRANRPIPGQKTPRTRGKHPLAGDKFPSRDENRRALGKLRTQPPEGTHVEKRRPAPVKEPSLVQEAAIRCQIAGTLYPHARQNSISIVILGVVSTRVKPQIYFYPPLSAIARITL